MGISIEGVASFSGRRPWLIVFSWLLILVAAGFSVTSLLPTALQGGQGPTQTLEYQKAQNLIDERFGPLDGVSEDGESEGEISELILFVSTTTGPGDSQFDSNVSSFAESLADTEAAAGVQILSSVWSDYPTQRSQDGTSLLVFASILRESETHMESLLHVAEEARSDDFAVYFIGDASINHTFGELAESDLQTGESIGIAVALIILALVFGAVVAAFIPIILAIVAIFATLGVTGVVGQIFDLNEFVPNIMTMVGLAVGIDYSLFILSRYREERNRGLAKQQAIEASSGSAGRAVVFSGLTVVLALLGMLIIPERTFQAFGLGAIMVVFVAVIAGMTLLPALIGILGDRVWAVRAPVRLTLGLFILGSFVASLTIGIGPQLLAVSALVMIILSVLTALRKLTGSTRSYGLGKKNSEKTSGEGGIWDTITTRVMKRPWLSMAIATTFLVVLGSFYFQLEKGTGGVSALPDDEPVKQGFELLDAKYGFGSNAPVLVVIDGDIGSTEFALAISKLEEAIADDSGLLMLYPDDDNPNRQFPVRLEPGVSLASLSAVLPGDPSDQKALNTVRRLRNELIPNAFSDIPTESYSIYVGGSSALIVDAVKITDQYLPIVFAAVLGLSFILLLFAFRSITISFASIVMNLLSVGASYGLVVLVFQKGFLIDLFGFQQVDRVEFWLPLFMFSILFGLSMDYHVFMLSRIKEHYDITGLPSESVAFGLRTSASIITGAALIMVAVFGGFALSDLSFFQSMGFGLGAAVLLDATVVRSLLVPSVMRILGRHAWYLPSWLEWIPNISIEGKSDSATVGSD